MKEAVRLQERKWGRDHPELYRALVTLSLVLKEQRKSTEAESASQAPRARDRRERPGRGSAPIDVRPDSSGDVIHGAATIR